MGPVVYRAPLLDPVELQVIEMIEALRAELQHRASEPQRWVGGLRRMSFARAVQASNSIEGYNAGLDDVVAAVDGEEQLDSSEETKLAVAGYRDAMTYILQLAQEPDLTVDESLIKALHYMMMKHDLSKNPGRWRPGVIYVRQEPSGDIVHEGPDAGRIDELILAMLAGLSNSQAPVLVRAAMVHLNLVMIHPFSDGNGRMGRCVQTLVLAREQILVPMFCSIEEYLGRNTSAYYDVLAKVGQGSWNPQNDTRPWIRFCLQAHYRQAATLLRRILESEKLWVRCAYLVKSTGLPERCIPVLWDAAVGLRIRNAGYRSSLRYSLAETISDLTATRDLKRLVDVGLLTPAGQGRGRYYTAAKTLRAEWLDVRKSRPPRDESDPFATAEKRLSSQLDLSDV